MPRPRKGNNKKTFVKNVQEIVRKEIREELEEKHAITEYADVLINKDIPSGAVINGDGNFFKILPEIDQSPTGEAGRAYNTRIGNEINLKEIDITGQLSYAYSSTGLSSVQNAKLACRVMILRAKAINDQELLFDEMPTDTLIRFGNQGAGTANGAAPFGGYSLDAFRDLNRDTFSVKYDKVFYLNAPVVQPGITNVDYSVIPSSSKLFRHKLKFGKNGLKLKYSAQADTNPNNFPYFMVIGYSSMSSPIQPGDGLVRTTISCVGTYTDA